MNEERKSRKMADKAKKLLSHPDVKTVIENATFSEGTAGGQMSASLEILLEDNVTKSAHGSDVSGSWYVRAKKRVIESTTGVVTEGCRFERKSDMLEYLRNDLESFAQKCKGLGQEPVFYYPSRRYGQIWTWVKAGQASGKYVLPVHLQKGGRPRKKP